MPAEHGSQKAVRCFGASEPGLHGVALVTPVEQKKPGGQTLH